MSYRDLAAPSLEDFEEMAEAAFLALPAGFRARTGRLVIRVADFAAEDVLRELSIDNPFDLTGLYEGIALTEQSTGDLPAPPPTVWLFRRAILDEWADRGEVALGHLIAHVLVHEVAHHFGYSDDDIAAIDDWRI